MGATRDGAVTTTETPAKAAHKVGVKQIVAFVFGLLIVAAIFLFAIPKFADYGDVWAAIKTLTWREIAWLVAATLWNLVTYWLVVVQATPGLTIPQAAVLTQSHSGSV